MQIRWILTDPDSYYALPGNLGSLLDSDAVAAMSITTTIFQASLVYGTLAESAGNTSGFCGSRPVGSEYAYFFTADTTSTVCGGMQNTIVAPAVGGQEPAGQRLGEIGHHRVFRPAHEAHETLSRRAFARHDAPALPPIGRRARVVAGFGNRGAAAHNAARLGRFGRQHRHRGSGRLLWLSGRTRARRASAAPAWRSAMPGERPHPFPAS